MKPTSTITKWILGKTASMLPRDVSISGMNQAIDDLHGIHNIYDDTRFNQMVERARAYTKNEAALAHQKKMQEQQQKTMASIARQKKLKEAPNRVVEFLKSFGLKV